MLAAYSVQDQSIKVIKSDHSDREQRCLDR